MLTVRSLYCELAGRVVRAAGVARANDLHHRAVMLAQSDLPFRWCERAAIHARVWVYDRICGPINH